MASARGLELIRREADEVVCPHALERFFAVGAHYASFAQVDDEAVLRLLDENRREQLRAARPAESLRSP